jgi:peptidoglycan/xylan/chitin deacetylase (PgdA/CDA1 family)
MKAVMYHYVRHHDDALPHQRYLHVADFERQLDWFDAGLGFVSRDQFDEALLTGRAADGVVLTFDDSLRDHSEVVLPILEARGLWGIFYVPTMPYRTGRLLSVHRLHLLLGTFGGRRLLDEALCVVDDEMLAHHHVEEFHTATYGRLDDDAATDRFKRMLNYFISEQHRDAVIDRLVEATGIDETVVADSYYVEPAQLRAMHDAGMVIGSHSDAHLVLSTLDDAAQRADIALSMWTLHEMTGSPVETFCYPFGGFHTFSRSTEQALTEAGIRTAFNVEPRDISRADLIGRPLALPRYDCNAFPHGRASVGSTAQG